MNEKSRFMLYAIMGGMALSLLHLVEICQKGEECNFLLFFLGMAVSGIVGLIGFLSIEPVTNSRAAIMAGVAAPKILGSLATTGGSFIANIFILLSGIFPAAYAQTSLPLYKVQNPVATVIVINENSQEIKVITPSGEAVTLKDTTILHLEKFGNLEFISSGYESTVVRISPGEGVVNLVVQAQDKENVNSFLKGMFAQQASNVANKLKVVKMEGRNRRL
jgi:hypothetical protein